MRHLTLSFLSCLGVCLGLCAQETDIPQSPPKKTELTRKPCFEVASLGASTTGFLVEGSAGAIRKGNRNRFHTHSSGPNAGFLGPQTASKALTLKDQPGIFPAPLMGLATIIFTFNCEDSKACFTPVVIRPDGTVFHGLSMTALHSPQTLVISSPAQTGIYTLFVLADKKDHPDTYVIVNAAISTQPQNEASFFLKTFAPQEKDAELISAEFVYTPNS